MDGSYYLMFHFNYHSILIGPNAISLVLGHVFE